MVQAVPAPRNRLDLGQGHPSTGGLASLTHTVCGINFGAAKWGIAYHELSFSGATSAVGAGRFAHRGRWRRRCSSSAATDAATASKRARRGCWDEATVVSPWSTSLTPSAPSAAAAPNAVGRAPSSAIHNASVPGPWWPAWETPASPAAAPFAVAAANSARAAHFDSVRWRAGSVCPNWIPPPVPAAVPALAPARQAPSWFANTESGGNEY